MNVSLIDKSLISEIAERAVTDFPEHGATQMDLEMDITSAHLQFNLDLDRILEAGDFDFNHDVFGIHYHMNRARYPGRVVGGFLPRLRVKQQLRRLP